MAIVCTDQVGGPVWQARSMVVRHIRRAVISVVGLAVVGLGIILLPLPGPGFLVIAGGFAILATEYEWARRALDWARDRAIQAAEQATQHWWSSAITILFGLGMLSVGIVFVVATPDLPFANKGTGVGVIIGALALLGTAIYAIKTPGLGQFDEDPKVREQA